ncbi:transmembrane protein [Anaeramoeba flamelloides]|uniref:Transmembrane protein n=1 Tax=Anaeramoeba flamelloides TaxID=1746091 RepID=A0ABQ8Z8W5_9EUKA|nr:transmembrane protein [Anaeramoeba flamelloides]
MYLSTRKLKIDEWKKKNLLIFFGIFFFFILLGFIIGMSGPKKYNSVSVDSYLRSSNSKIEIQLNNISRINQFLFVEGFFVNSVTYGVKVPITFSVELYGTKKQHSKEWGEIYQQNSPWKMISNTTHNRTILCNPETSSCESQILVYETINQYSNFYFKINAEFSELTDLFQVVEFNYVNSSMTVFEILFRYFFIILTLFIIVYLTRYTRQYSFHNFLIEQKWISLLVISLLLFNNPFYPIITLSNSSFFRILDALFTSTFFGLLLYFIWIKLDSFRYQKFKRTFLKFYLPRSIPILILMIFFFILYVYGKFHEMDDPQYQQAQDTPGYMALKWLHNIILNLYNLFILYSIIRNYIYFKQTINNQIHENEGINYNKKRFNFFLLVSVLPFFTLIILLFGNFLHELKYSSFTFLFTYSVCNAYIIALSIAFLPSKKDKNSEDFVEDQGAYNKKKINQQTSSDQELEGNLISQDSQSDSNYKSINLEQQDLSEIEKKEK